MFSDDVVDNVTLAGWWASMCGMLGKDITKVAEQLLTALLQARELNVFFLHLDIYTQKLATDLELRRRLNLCSFIGN